LYLGNTPLFGGIYLPMFDDYYMADETGSYLNGDKIHVSKNKELSQTLLATGFPYYKFEELPEYLEILKHLMQHTRGLRRMGSAAVDLAYTAQGIFDGFFELNLSPWDVAAGAYIVKQAGGAVSSFTKNEDFIFGNSIVVGNIEIHSQLSKILKEKF
jgi:myo-inositol-1(or 4)-monophosphatase